MCNNYVIEKVAEMRWFLKFKDVNKKGEKLTIHLIKCKDNDSNNSLPKLWYKKGYKDRILENYWSVNTYIEDSEGNSFGLYNPQCKFDKVEKRNIINFDWMFEATSENKELLIKEIYNLFSFAKGKTATEEKNEKIELFATANNVTLYDIMPKEWSELKNAKTAPVGSVWISNMESFKSRNRKTALLIVS